MCTKLHPSTRCSLRVGSTSWILAWILQSKRSFQLTTDRPEAWNQQDSLRTVPCWRMVFLLGQHKGIAHQEPLLQTGL